GRLREPGEHEHLRQLRAQQHHHAPRQLRAALQLPAGRRVGRARARAAGGGSGKGDVLAILRRMHGALYVLAAALQTAAAPGGSPSPAAAAPSRQTESDEYTRYELLAPGSARFHIVYEVTATTPGATRFFNPIRKGSAASDEAVFDRMTGRPLPFRVVTGAEAKAGGVAEAEADAHFIAVELPRPVPAEGEVR